MKGPAQWATNSSNSLWHCSALYESALQSVLPLLHHCQPQKSVSQAKSGSERASPALNLLSCFVCLVCFGHCGNTFNIWQALVPTLPCPPWFATYCMLRLCGSCGLDPSLLAKFHLNTANVIELPRHLLLAMILLLQSPFASQSVWLCGCWVAVAATVAVAKKLSLAAPPPFLCWLATICLLLLPALHHFVFIIISTNFNKLQSSLHSRVSYANVAHTPRCTHPKQQQQQKLCRDLADSALITTQSASVDWQSLDNNNNNNSNGSNT